MCFEFIEVAAVRRGHKTGKATKSGKATKHPYDLFDARPGINKIAFIRSFFKHISVTPANG